MTATSSNTHPSRRKFIARSVQAAALISASGAVRATAIHNVKITGDQVRGFAIFGEHAAIAVDASVALYRLSGQKLKQIDAPAAVRAVAYGSTGRLFVALKNRIGEVIDDRIQLLPGNLQTLPADVTRKMTITSLTVGDTDELFAADSGNKVVWRIETNGETVSRIAPKSGEFKVSKAFFPITWNNGRLIVAEPGRHRVLSFDATGKQLDRWGTHSRKAEGFAGCCNPVGVAQMRDGTFVTAERGQVRIKRFDQSGSYLSELAGPDEFLASVNAVAAEELNLFGCQSGGMDIAVDHNGIVHVLDRVTRELRTLS
jgi:hypothetical protein